MSRFAWAAAVSTLLLSCATGGGGKASPDVSEPLERALAAMGGAERVQAIRTVTVKGAARHWEPEQSVTPGGEMRFAGESTFVQSRDLQSGATRTEWVRSLAYPAPRQYRFAEIVTPDAGYVDGVDSTARNKQSLDSDPPRHAMSGLRLAAAQRELLRTSPKLLAEMRAHPRALTRGPDEQVGRKRMPAVVYQWRAVAFTVIFDPDSGLPARVRTLDADNILGDSTYDLVLDDWREVQGVHLPHRMYYELAGREIVRIQHDEVRLDAPVAQEQLAIPPELRASAPRPAVEGVPYQWVLRRQHIGTYLDSDAVSFDPAASPGLRLAEVAPGVQQVVGGSHNSLVVEMVDHLVVFDAPIGEAQSRWTIDAAKAKYPGKPVKVLVLTHHHMDHAGGARTYVAEGATVVVGAGSGQRFASVFRAPHQVDGDALSRNPRPADIVEVADRKVLSDGRREVEILRVENPHADPMLIGYVVDARLAFVTDLWSPGRDKLGDKPTPGQAAVVAAMRKLGLRPERFAGGHGTTAEYAALEAIAE